MEKVDLELKRVFVCEKAVDVAKLLRLSRAELFEKARLWNANVLVNEQYVFLLFHRPSYF